LLALWVAHNHQEEHRKATREPLITLGLAPLESPTFRAALFEQLGSDGLEIPVTADIIGKSDAHSVRLDKEADDAVKKAQLHRKVATTIFFESNGGMSQAKADATVPEVKTDVFGPDWLCFCYGSSASAITPALSMWSTRTAQRGCMPTSM
jgi:hypothetical protein